MFSQFKRKKISINSVTIPDFGWTKTKEEKSIVQWIDPEQTIAISINFFALPPDLPTIKDINMLINFYRRSVFNVHGGLIEVSLSQKHNISSVKTIFKIPQENSGITYIASLTIPFKTCSFVLKVQAAEVGMTGMREALIGDRLFSTNTTSGDENGDSGWLFDPYDRSLQSGFLMNRSEQDCYDYEFPSHPLSQARQLIRHVEDGMRLTPELESEPSFDK